MKQEELGIQGQLEREKWEWVLDVCLGSIVRLSGNKRQQQVQQRLVQFMNVPNSQRGDSSYVQLVDKKM